MNKNKKEPFQGEISEEELTPKETPPDMEEVPEQQDNELNAKNNELNERLLRQMAEFDNYKKRTAKEKDEMGIFTKGICVKEMLGVLDNFERALAVDCKDEDYKKGMEMIFNQLGQVLQKLDVSEIEAYNAPFDPIYHNAINQVEDESFGENTVCQVLQKGYKIGDRVIRHAVVVVANP